MRLKAMAARILLGAAASGMLAPLSAQTFKVTSSSALLTLGAPNQAQYDTARSVPTTTVNVTADCSGASCSLNIALPANLEWRLTGATGSGGGCQSIDVNGGTLPTPFMTATGHFITVKKNQNCTATIAFRVRLSYAVQEYGNTYTFPALFSVTP